MQSDQIIEVKRLFLIAAGLASGVLFLELLLRVFFGLGFPPLYESDPRYEYRFKPNQQLRRFGNRIETNQWGMRSAPMQLRPKPNTRRVLVFGDSVGFGGAQVDQSAIATTRVLDQLRQTDPHVELGNVSAGSWGPGNWKGWAQAFGFMGATDVVLVVSTHDARDNPTFAPLNPQTHPTRFPPSAISELQNRYLNPGRIKYQLHSWGLLSQPAPAERPRPHAGSDHDRVADAGQGLADLRAFLLAAKRSGARVRVVQFWDRAEVKQQAPRDGHRSIQAVAQQLDVPVTQSLSFFNACSSNPSRELFVDAIHPYTEKGQACLAQVILAALA